MITQAQIDAISDEFQSTFSHIGPNTLSNMLYEKETETVAKLINKYIPDVGEIRFDKIAEVAPGYFMWVIQICPKNSKCSQCGEGIIHADTEDWKNPVCYECLRTIEEQESRLKGEE